MELNDKPCLKKNVKLRDERFGKLIVAAGLPMLCVNHDAVRLLDFADGQHTIGEMVCELLRENHDLDMASVSSATISFFTELNRLSLLA